MDKRMYIFIAFFFILIIFSYSKGDNLNKDICIMLKDVYKNCKIQIKSDKNSLICNELSLNTTFYFYNNLDKKTKKGENLSKLIGKVCFEACIGKGEIYKKLKKLFCSEN